MVLCEFGERKKFRSKVYEFKKTQSLTLVTGKKSVGKVHLGAENK